MKKIMCLSLIFLITLIYGCNQNEESDTYSPARTAFNMYFKSGSDEVGFDEVYFEVFKELFVDQREEEFIRKKFELVRQLRTNHASISTLALVQFENNQSLLVRLYHDTDKNEYLIYDVIKVPEDVLPFFNEALGNPSGLYGREGLV